VADLDVDVDHGVVMGLVRQMSLAWEDVVCECVGVGGCVRKSGGVEEMWRGVWLDKEEEERREEKRDDNSLIPSFPLLLLTFYTSIFCSNSFLVKWCAEFAITVYSWCVAARAFCCVHALEGFKPKHAAPSFALFSSFPTFDTSLFLLHLTHDNNTTHTPPTITTRLTPHSLLS